MTTIAHGNAGHAAYVAAVREALSDVPAVEREELLAELNDALVEAANHGDGNLVARLGSAADFASELRLSAGLLPPEPSASPGGRRGRRRLLPRWRRHVREHAATVAALRAAHELAPAWWLLRGVVVAMLFAGFLGGGAVMLGLIAVPLSLAAGLRTSRLRRGSADSRELGVGWRTRRLLDRALMVLAVPVLLTLLVWMVESGAS